MRGLMMDRPLLISGLIQYAAEYHGDTEIVTRTVEGPIHRYNYAESEARAKQIANALTRLGIKLGDRAARPCCTAWRRAAPTRSLSRPRIRCCRSCRCSTPTPGARPIAPPMPAR